MGHAGVMMPAALRPTCTLNKAVAFVALVFLLALLAGAVLLTAPDDGASDLLVPQGSTTQAGPLKPG
jgi:hypothetical protein